MLLFFFSCVADNSLGRAKKYIEVSGRPGPAEFHSPVYSRSRDTYNLTWTVESVPQLEEIRLLYRKLMVRLFFIFFFLLHITFHLRIINKKRKIQWKYFLYAKAIFFYTQKKYYFLYVKKKYVYM